MKLLHDKGHVKVMNTAVKVNTDLGCYESLLERNFSTCSIKLKKK